MEFNDWLNQELSARGWSQMELARRGDISQSQVSMVLMGKSLPGLDMCVAVARAFGMRREDVLRMAGHLEPLPDVDDPVIPELTYLVKRIPRKARISLLDYARFLDGRQPITAIREAAPVYDLTGLIARLSPEQQETLAAFLRMLVG